MPERYAIVMPAYNEEASIGRVLDEWLEALKDVDAAIIVVNDGSRDRTGAIVSELAGREPRVLLLDKPNSGHGQSCVAGYRKAVALGFDYVFQTDSDGQIGPADFLKHRGLVREHPFVLGWRPSRGDGSLRLAISRVLSAVVFLSTGIFLRDSNVPFRFFQRELLARVVADFPPDFYMANILVALRAARRCPDYAVVAVSFRPRFGGKASVSGLRFLRLAVQLVRQLKDASL